MSSAQPANRNVPVLRATVQTGPHAGMTAVWKRAGRYVIGRGNNTQLVLAHDILASMEHCRIDLSEHGCVVEDLGSGQGTLVNQQRISRSWIQPGDVLRVGMSNIVLSFTAQAAALATVSIGSESSPAVNTSAMEASATKQRDDGLLGIPGYSIHRKIGTGGMGVVYEAWRDESREKVAIKTIIPTAGTAARAVELFRREMKVLAQLEHPRIVRFIDAGEYAGQIYLVMEYVETIELEKLVHIMPANRKVALYCGLVCQVLEALQYAHEQKLVHRDIKPRNILFSRNKNAVTAKLADFGLAKNFELAGLSQLTADHELRGTPAFMPREQWQNSRYAKPTADVYSSAATLFYYLTGCPPQFTQRPKKALSQITSLFQFAASDSLPEPSVDLAPLQARSDLPSGLAEVLQRALANNPKQRFPSAAEMRTALLPFARS